MTQASKRPPLVNHNGEEFTVTYFCKERIDVKNILQSVHLHDQLVEALEEARTILYTHVIGNNLSSLYKDGKHDCYVLGAPECLNKIKEALKKATEE